MEKTGMNERNNLEATIVEAPLLDRRALLRGGLVAGAGLVLAGCAGRPPSKAMGPVWPDQEPNMDGQASMDGLGGVQAPRPYIAPPPPSMSQNLGNIPTGVMSRSAWTSARPLMRSQDPTRGADSMGYVGMITIHHDAINSVGLTSQSAVARRLEGVRQSHVRNGWADIGYHYIIDPAGRVWQGRPIGLQGAHVKDHNPHNLGVMCMGNFNQHSPTREQMTALDAFVASQMQGYRVPVNRVYTHRELMPTACPGSNLQRYMLATRGRSGRLGMTYA